MTIMVLIRSMVSKLEGWIPCIALLGSYLALCIPLVLSTEESNYSHDEQHYHIPAVLQIYAKYPSLDLKNDCLSATAPGYHYFLASVAQLTGTGKTTLRTINLSLGVIILIILFSHGRKYLAGWDAALWILPLAYSNFFIKSSGWVVTDNAALLLIVLCLLATGKKIEKLTQISVPAFISALATFTRQMNLWTAVLLPAANIPSKAGASPDERRIFYFSLLGTLPPLVVILLLFSAWKGLVPQRWSEASLTISTTGPIYAISILGIFGLVYLWNLKPFDRKTLLAVACGIAFSITASTTHCHEQGRWGGYLWNLSDLFPSICDRNLLFVILCGLGSGMAFVLWQALRPSDRVAANVFIVAMSAWLATFVVNRQVFHRYFEPLILVFLVVYAVKIPRTAQQILYTRRWLTACSIAQVGITLATVHFGLLR